MRPPPTSSDTPGWMAAASDAELLIPKAFGDGLDEWLGFGYLHGRLHNLAISWRPRNVVMQHGKALLRHEAF